MSSEFLILKLDIQNEMDVMLAHRRAMQFAKFSGIGLAEQTRFATAVSEIGRNALEYAGKGAISFTITKGQSDFYLEAIITDQGKGITNVPEILNRNPETHRGRGLGIVYANRLADTFRINSTTKGTIVVIQKNIPVKNGLINKLVIAGWLKHLANEPAISAYEELKLRNSQLLELTEELTANGEMVDKQMIEIRQLNMQLSENNERMKEFTYAISHDLKNPLSSLKLAAEHLSQHSQDEETAIYHGIVARSVNRLDKTIHSLIEILDIQNQTKRISKELEFEQLFSDTKDEFASLIENTGASIEADFTAVPRICYVEGYLQSIFHNLISNSLKYKHPDKKPAISIATARVNKVINLTFSDNGTGMDLLKMGDKLFMPFMRFSNTTDGKGIGLYLIKGMVESNGGKVSVVSEPGEGTRFTFQLIPYL